MEEHNFIPVYDNIVYTQSAYCTGLIGQLISQFHWDNNLYFVGRQGMYLGIYIGLIGNPSTPSLTNHTYIHTHIKIFVHMPIIVLIFIQYGGRTQFHLRLQ